MKKTLALLLAVMMVLCLCAACGDKAEEAAPEAAAPAADAAPAAPAEGDPTGEPPTGEPQQKELFPADGYDKTFVGYKAYVTDAMTNDGGSPFLEQELADVAAATEETYDPTASPWAMSIEFGLILSYEDFVK